MPDPLVSRRRAWPRWAVVGLVGAAGLAGVALAVSPGGSAEPVSAEQRFADTCRDHFMELTGGDRLPPRMMTVDRPEARLWVYVADGEVFLCRSADPASVHTVGFPVEPDRDPGALQLFGGETAVVEEALLVGRVPPGTDRVTARLATGEIMTGVTDGDLFAIWPHGAPVAGARVTAHGPSGILGTATAPSP